MNADPEAALSAIRLAAAFRREFGEDFVIDLIGYRRHGHQEQDEPAYTQPLMATQIERQPSVREKYAAKLVAEGPSLRTRRRDSSTRRSRSPARARGARAGNCAAAVRARA